jgi:hypothetical protein
VSIEEAERPEDAPGAADGVRLGQATGTPAWPTVIGSVPVGVDVVSMGRIVRFVNGFDEERAAIVTQVEPDGRVRLCSFRLTGIPEPIADAVPYDAAGGPFTWHWPEIA